MASTDEIADAVAGLSDPLEHVANALTRSDYPGEATNVTDALLGIGEAATQVARAIHRLGNADAATSMGGLEAHGACVQQLARAIADAGGLIAEAIDGLADAVRTPPIGG